MEEISDERIVSLFVATLEDFDDDDLVRIEILNSLVMRKDPPDSHARIAKAVMKVLRNDEDEVVRQHAATALCDFADVPNVLECLERIVKKASKYYNVRFNAFSSISLNTTRVNCPEPLQRLSRESLRRLVDVPEFGHYAERDLKRAHKET